MQSRTADESPAITRAPLGAILAGGRASRFGGQPKGLMKLGGRRIIDRLAAALEPVAAEIVLVGDATGAETWLPGTRIVRDRYPSGAALTGLHAALAEAGAGGSAFVLAWDMPFVTPALLEMLLRSAAKGPYDAVVPLSARGAEACCAWYRGACASIAAAAIERGDLRLGAFVDSLPHVRRVYAHEIAASGAGDPDVLFRNVNTPDDLDEANALLEEAE